MDSLESLISTDVLLVPSRILLVAVYALVLFPLCLAKSLRSKRLVYTAYLSVALYIAWLVTIIVAHAQGSLDADTVVTAYGHLFQDISACSFRSSVPRIKSPLPASIAFTFSSVVTLQMYAGMVGVGPSGDKKEKRYLHISSISLSATLFATVMVLPLLFPQVKNNSHDPSSVRLL